MLHPNGRFECVILCWAKQKRHQGIGGIFLRFKKKCKNKINAKTVCKLTVTQLKSCGLSRQKVKGIKSLAKQTLNKTFDSKLIPSMSDEEAIIYLSKLRQIGRWSAEMILLFTYNRSNIWPIQEIGLLMTGQVETVT